MSKFILPILLLLFSVLSLHLGAQEGENMVHVDEMPYFPGCNDFEGNPEGKRKCSNYNLVSFISTTLKYPEEAKKETLEGTVIMSFVVTNEGYVKDAFVLKDIGGGCGQAALNVIENMPRWEPGVHQGKKVNVKLNLPVKFSLSSGGVSSKYRVLWGNTKGKTITKQEIKDNLLESITVRDPYGEEIAVTEVIIAYERKKKFIDAIGLSKVNVAQKRLLKKARKKGILTFSATIQKDGQFIEVDREFEVIKAK